MTILADEQLEETLLQERVNATLQHVGNGFLKVTGETLIMIMEPLRGT